MKASAYVVGPRRGPSAALHHLAGQLGFDTVLPYEGIAEVERQAEITSLQFFLFAEVPVVSRLASAAQAIRFSTGRKVRFSPLIYFCTSPSVETIRTLIDMGFDDVITAPYTPQRVEPRLRRQVETELLYFETSSYFGPDRRHRPEGEPRASADERRGDGLFRRLAIVRHMATGIDVLHDDQQIVL